MANYTTRYSAAIAEEICDRLAAGSSLRQIETLEGMPPESTVRRWVADDRDGFAAHYARAREIGYHKMADELLDIADDGTNDTRTSDDGRTITDQDVIQRSKLRVDTRKWLLSKMLPKVYGDKTQVELAGKDGGPVGFVLMGAPEQSSAAEWLTKTEPQTGE